MKTRYLHSLAAGLALFGAAMGQSPIVLSSKAGFSGRVSVGAVLAGPMVTAPVVWRLKLDGVDTVAKRAFTGARYLLTSSEVLSHQQRQGSVDLSVGGWFWGADVSVRDYASEIHKAMASDVVEEGAAVYPFRGLDVSVARREIEAILASDEASQKDKDALLGGFLVIGVVREVLVRRWMSLASEEMSSLSVKRRRISVAAPFVEITGSIDAESRRAFTKKFGDEGWALRGFPGKAQVSLSAGDMLRAAPFDLPVSLDARSPGEFGVVTELQLYPVAALVGDPAVSGWSSSVQEEVEQIAHDADQVLRMLRHSKFEAVRLVAAELLDDLGVFAQHSWSYGNAKAEFELAKMRRVWELMRADYLEGLRYVTVEYRMGLAETQVGHGHTPVSIMGEGCELLLTGGESPTHPNDKDDAQYRGVWVWVVPEDGVYDVVVRLRIRGDAGGRRNVSVWAGDWGGPDKWLHGGRASGGGDISVSQTMTLKKGDRVRVHMMGTEDREFVSREGSEVVFVRRPTECVADPVDVSRGSLR